MRLTLYAKLLLGLGCCVVATSRLNGQGSGLPPGNPNKSARSEIGENRPSGVEQPRVRLKDDAPSVRSPAEELRDLTQGGRMLDPQIGFPPDPPTLKSTEYHFPSPQRQFPPPADHSSEIGAIFSLATPLGIILAFIMMDIARRRQEQASRSGSCSSTAGPVSQGSVHRGRSFVKLGTDGNGEIMYRG
jgi:hypothetical protein